MVSSFAGPGIRSLAWRIVSGHLRCSAGSRGRSSARELSLAKILRCGECTKPLYGQLPSGSRSRAIYACKKGHVGISARLLEQYLIRERAFGGRTRRARTGRLNGRNRSALRTGRRLTNSTKRTRLIDELMAAYKAGDLRAAIVFPQVDELYEERAVLQKQLDTFLAVPPTQHSPLRRSSVVLEWLMEMQGPFVRETPGKLEDWQKPGESFDDEDESEEWAGNSWRASTTVDTEPRSTTGPKDPGVRRTVRRNCPTRHPPTRQKNSTGSCGASLRWWSSGRARPAGRARRSSRRGSIQSGGTDSQHAAHMRPGHHRPGLYRSCPLLRQSPRSDLYPCQ